MLSVVHSQYISETDSNHRMHKMHITENCTPPSSISLTCVSLACQAIATHPPAFNVQADPLWVLFVLYSVRNLIIRATAQ